MTGKSARNTQVGFCIFIDTLCQGTLPSVSDGDGLYVVFQTELEAQKEIADNMIFRLQQFLDDERDFEDAITLEEFVGPVTVDGDGVITDSNGNRFGPRVD